MNMMDTPLDQLGSSAAGHYRVAEKAAGKAEEHYKSCGIILKAAKLKVLKTRGLTWEQFLIEHFPSETTGRATLSRRRADEIIEIADGRRTLDEVREQKNESSKAAHAKTRADAKAYQNRHCSAPDRSEKPNDFNDGPSKSQSSPEAEPEIDPVKEAEDISAKAHAQQAEEANRRNVTPDRSEKPNDFNDGPPKSRSSSGTL